MSTIVSYKGEPLVTVNNNTKTLTTQGKYLEANIVLTDTTDSWSWMGKNPTKIYAPEVDTTYFKNSDWVNWTPVTTATKITDAKDKGTFVADTEHYEYLVHTQMYEEIYYNEGASGKAQLLKGGFEQWYNIVRYPSNYANLNNQVRNANVAASVISQTFMFYLTTKGANSVTYSWGYGLYPTATAPTFNNSTTVAPTVTVKVPALNARCSDSYLTTANAAFVDTNNSFFKLKYEVYQVDVGTSILRNAQDNRMEIFHHGLH